MSNKNRIALRKSRRKGYKTWRNYKRAKQRGEVK